MNEFSFVIAFFIGALSTLHCLGMCSGIVGALTFSLPPAIQKDRKKIMPYLLSYNLGRILSYTVIGAILGGLSGYLTKLSPEIGHFILETCAATALLLMGLYLAGWFPKYIVIEKIGKPVWQIVEPYGRRLLPVKSLKHALAFGIVWGWLPCGLVYSTLIWSASSGSASQSAFMMMSFGLGTLPTVFFAGMLSASIARLARIPELKQGMGSILIIIGLTSLFFVIQPDAHRYLHWGGEISHAHTH